MTAIFHDFIDYFKKINRRCFTIIRIGFLLTVLFYIIAAVFGRMFVLSGNFDYDAVSAYFLNNAPYMFVISFACSLLGDIIIKHDAPEE